MAPFMNKYKMSCHPDDEPFVVTHLFWACILRTLHTCTLISCACVRLSLGFVKFTLIAMDRCLLCQVVFFCLFVFLHQILTNTLDESKGLPPLLRLSGKFMELSWILKFSLLAQIIPKVVGSSLIPQVRQKIEVKKREWLKRGPGWPKKRF